MVHEIERISRATSLQRTSTPCEHTWAFRVKEALCVHKECQKCNAGVHVN